MYMVFALSGFQRISTWYCYNASRGEFPQPQWFAGISCEPYYSVRKHTKPNEVIVPTK